MEMSLSKRFQVLTSKQNRCFTVIDAIEQTMVACLKNAQQAAHLAQLFNDSGCHADVLSWLTDKENKRIAEICKLFCLQENLTWADLGFDDEQVRNANWFLEMPLNLREREGA